jgi:hypothetical protein
LKIENGKLRIVGVACRHGNDVAAGRRWNGDARRRPNDILSAAIQGKLDKLLHSQQVRAPAQFAIFNLQFSILNALAFFGPFALCP